MFNMSKAFNSIWHTGLMEFRVRCLALFRLCPFNLISYLPLGPTVFLICINELHVDAICDIAICADDTTLYSKCLICGSN